MGPVIRPLKALLVALAIAAGTGTGIGFASADDGDVPLPAEVAMASPRGGEVGSFSATAAGLYATGAPSTAPFEVASYARWTGPTMPDAYGRPTTTDGIAWGGLAFVEASDLILVESSAPEQPLETGWVPTGGLDYFRAGTPELLVSGGSFNFSQEWSYQPSPLLPPQEGTVAYNVTQLSYSGTSSCLLATPLQGRSLPSSDPVPWIGCDLAGVATVPEGTPFVATGAQRLAGFEAVRLEAMDDGTSIVFYVNATMPVPLRVEFASPDGQLTIDLVRFGEGSQAASVPVPAEPPLAIERAPRTPWGADDKGSRLSFPPSAAYQRALEDPTFPDLRDYMAAHPDAYAGAVSCHADVPRNDGTSRSCAFTVTDGPTALFVMVLQDVRNPSAPGLPGLPEVIVTYQFVAQLLEDAAYPTPDQVLADWPTLRALEDRYATFSGEADSPVNSLWLVYVGGFEGSEAMPDEADGFELLADVGFLDMGMALAPIPDPMDPRLKYVDFHVGDKSLMSDANGRALFYHEAGLSEDSRVQVVPAAGPPEPLPDQEAGGAPLAASLLGFWAGAPPEQVVGVGILAILGGLLYWLWPSLKAGAFFGLFSRVQGPQLLQHPARSQLVQIVQAEPGIHFQDLVRRSGLPNGTAVHHLRKLAQSGLVSARPLGRYTCYFPGSSPDRAALASAPILRSDGARRVYEAIQGNPGLSGLQLASLVQLQPSTVNYHVQRLVECGLVNAARDGRSVRLSPAAAS